jgi:hypothetical protein
VAGTKPTLKVATKRMWLATAKAQTNPLADAAAVAPVIKQQQISPGYIPIT